MSGAIDERRPSIFSYIRGFYTSSISNKILVVLSLFAALTVGITWVATKSIRELAQHEARLNNVAVNSLRIMAHAQEHLTALHQMSFEMNTPDASGRPVLLDEFKEEAAELQADMVQLKPLLEEDDQAAFRTIQECVDQYLAMAAENQAMLAENQDAAASDLLRTKGVEIFERGDEKFDYLVEDETSELARESQETQQHAAGSLIIMALTGLAGLVIIATLALVIVRREITSPLKTVTTALNRLAEGDETVDVQSMPRADEVGALSRAFEAFRSASIAYRHNQEKARAQLEDARREAEHAREAAEAASTAKSAFLANMSHEIRTPLNGILGMAQALDMGELSPDQGEQVGIILESGRTLMAVLNDVLDLSKIEAGKLVVTPADADLKQLLSRLRGLWRARAEEKGIDLNLSIDSEMPAMLAFDAVRVQQCVSNLISNAVKFTETGSVTIAARWRPLETGHSLVEIKVIDTGIGMSEETLGQLFRPFMQADESSTRRFGGTGLGLSITRRLAQLMGGDAAAKSQPGQGSEFTLRFQAAPAEAGAMGAPATELPESSGREAIRASKLRILLVDDNAINRRVASLFLKPLCSHIVEAGNGAEALAELEQGAFDLILLDMHMPVMDGPSAVREIRSSGQLWAGIHIIALTADAMSGDRERYLAMGMDGYLSKPLSERDLISEIVRVRSGKPWITRLAS